MAHETDWRDHFANSTTRVAFSLQLSRNQSALLCALEDGSWKTWWTTGLRNPFYSTFLSLEGRGLCERNEPHYRDGNWKGWRYRLTPAGEHVLALLRLAGVVPETAANSESRVA